MSNCSRQTLPDAIMPLIFTENAANKVAQLIEEEGDNSLKLRVYVEGGGCSGFQYGFTLEDQVKSDDHCYHTSDVTLVVDSKSATYLSGAKIDYVEDLQGERFTINNPNAKKSCSCGTSFDIDAGE